MKILVQRLVASPHYTRTLEWGKLLTIAGGIQALVQGIGLLSGILVIRLLPTKEYALYTLANTMLGTMLVLADGGISSGVMAQGGKVWQDREKLGVVLATGLDLRKKFAVGSLLLATPILVYLLHYHGASWLMSLLLTASLIPAFVTTLSGVLLEIVPKLQQDIIPLQRIQLENNVCRLTLLLTSLFLFPWSSIAILAAGIPQFWANIRLRKIVDKYADKHEQPNLVIRKELLTFVKRILPGSIYYALSGQITIWLMSIFGSTIAVAQIGALNRLAILLSFFSLLFSTIISPRFARLPEKSSLLLSRYLQIQIGFVLLSGFIIIITYLFPSNILWILGQKYANLTSALMLTVINSCLGLVIGASFIICTSRGWAINPLASIPITIGAIIIGIVIFDLNTLIGILKLNIFTMYFSYSLFKIMNVNRKLANC
jgi:O-antigen/teichoic acid export membrane protein